MAGTAVALVWRRSTDPSLRSVALLAGTLMAVPLALLYDQMLWLVALGWLVRAARQDGFLPWEKLVLAACYPAILFTWLIATRLHLPLGPVESAALLVLVWRRLRHQHGGAWLPWRRLPALQAFGSTP